MNLLIEIVLARERRRARMAYAPKNHTFGWLYGYGEEWVYEPNYFQAALWLHDLTEGHDWAHELLVETGDIDTMKWGDAHQKWVLLRSERIAAL